MVLMCGSTAVRGWAGGIALGFLPPEHIAMAARELAHRGIGGLPVTGLGDDGSAGGERLVLQRQRGSVGIENAVPLAGDWAAGRVCADGWARTGGLTPAMSKAMAVKERMRVAHRGFLSSKTGRRSAVLSV
jgi:hypothetical protein